MPAETSPSTPSITEDALEALFVKNHLNPNASYNGLLFETSGKELAFVTAQPADQVATYLDGEQGLYIARGYHFVNRVGYFVSAAPLPEFEDICVLRNDEIDD
jgi:hypothetical protein